MDKETHNQKKGSFTVKQAFGIIIFVVSVAVVCILVTAGKLFGYMGEEIFAFVLGAFGYSAYAVFVFLVYLGFSMFAQVKVKVSRRTLVFLFLSLLSLIFLIHDATAAKYFASSFGVYSKQCFEAGLAGLATATFGGVVFGFPCFFIARAISLVGSYILYSLCLVGMLGLLFNVPALLQKRRGDPFQRRKIKEDGVKDYDLTEVLEEGNYDVNSVGQKLFIANVDDYLPKKTRKKSQAYDILLSNQQANPNEKITYMNGQTYTRKEDIAEKLGQDIFNSEHSYTETYQRGRDKREDKPAKEEKKRDKKSIILTPPDDLDSYLGSLGLAGARDAEERRSAPKPTGVDTMPADTTSIPAKDLRGELPLEPEPPRADNAYENYANGIFIDNTERDRRRRERAEAKEAERRAAEGQPKVPGLPIVPDTPNLYGSGVRIVDEQSGEEQVPVQKPIISSLPKREEPAADVRRGSAENPDRNQDPTVPNFGRIFGRESGATVENLSERETRSDEPELRLDGILSDSTAPRKPARELDTNRFDEPFGSAGAPGVEDLPRNAGAGRVPPIPSSRQTEEFDFAKEDEDLGFAKEDFDAPFAPGPIPGAPAGGNVSANRAAREPVYPNTPELVAQPRKPHRYLYTKPPLELLHDFSFDPNNVEENFEERRGQIEMCLSNFRIEAKVVHIVAGPSVTRYELQMPAGVPVSRVVQRSDDLAMAVASPSGVRIEAPIPGKSLLGIEVPNKKRQTVVLRDVLDTPDFFEHKSPIVFALGKEIDGKNRLCDIAKMPHMLIAGATGSGKSVCLNTLILSLLFKSSPEDVRMILIDPKRVEFSVYAGLPHLLLKDIVTSVEKAVSALNWACDEMMRRLGLFEELGVRDINAYNAKIDRETTEKLPLIVIIVDEFAELMASKMASDVEHLIQRLTQLSRAAGIHLVLATQRPSVDVITGVIKSNLPARIAFRVASQMDSRTILDGIGGEQLLGNGDMIYKTALMNVRLQGPFVSDDEVSATVAYIKDNNEAYFDEKIEQAISAVKPDPAEEEKADASSGGEKKDGLDEYFIPALRMGIEAGQVSISMIQRRFSVGYSRAGKLIDEMEKMGYITPFEGSKPRKPLITPEEFKQRFGDEEDPL